MFNTRNKKVWALIAVLISTLLFTHIADAKRLSGGRSFGRQSSNVQRQSAPAPAASPAPAPQRVAPTPAPAPAAAPQPQAAPVTPPPQRNRWLGPLGGLAAGLGLGALMSHFGMGGFGGGMGSLLMPILLAVGGVFLYSRFFSKPNNTQSAAPQPHADQNNTAQSHNWPVYSTPQPDSGRQSVMESFAQSSTPAAVTETVPSATWSIPADFDRDSFLRTAKVIFIRLQAAWDTANLADIREFTSNEMFAEIKLELNEHSASNHQTDVIELHAELLGIENQSNGSIPTEQLASVRFAGNMRENADAAAEPFSEVWHFSRPVGSNGNWLLAGIQQETA